MATWDACTSQYDGQRLTDRLQRAARDREPRPAEDREERGEAADRRADRVRREQVTEHDPERGKREQADEDQRRHPRPLGARETDAERDARQIQAREREAGHDVARHDLRAEVRPHRKRRDSELAVPARRALACDARAGRQHRVHRAERGKADHEVERRRQSGMAEVGLVPVRARSGSRGRAGSRARR